MHIPLGLLLDRYPIKYIISLCFLLCALGLAPLFLSDVWMLSVLGRFAVGAGSSGAILCVFKIIKMYFPDQYFSRLLGVSVTLGLLGAVYGSQPVDILNQRFGWIPVTATFFIIALFLGLITLFFMPQQDPARTHTSSLRKELGALKDKRLIAVAVLSGLMSGPMEGFADMWAVPFLETIFSYERNLATSLPSLIYIGMGLGSMILPSLAERQRAYIPLITISALMMMASFFIILTLRPSPTMMSFLFLTIGFFSAYQILAISFNVLIAPTWATGLVSSITNMVIMGFGYLFHMSLARIVFMAESQTLPILTSLPPLSTGVLLLPITLALSALGFMVLKKFLRP